MHSIHATEDCELEKHAQKKCSNKHRLRRDGRNNTLKKRRNKSLAKQCANKDKGVEETYLK